jgi:hypothetical protein
MKSWLLATFFNLVLAGWGMAQLQSEELLIMQSEKSFYYLPQLSQEEIQHCLENLSSSILVCPEGTSLPLALFLKGDLVEIEPNIDPKYQLKIKQTFYLCYQNDQILISLNGSNWKTWQKMLAGLISLTIGVDERGPGLKLDVETYLRLYQEDN